MTYPEAIRYLESFINYERISAYPYKESLGLERIKGFLGSIGNPQNELRCLHIAGTKGKGSTCAFLTYILRQAGYRTGLYTSPHLGDFRERIRVLNPKPETLNPKQTQNSKFKTQRSGIEFEGMISKGGLAALATRLKPAICEYNRSSKYGPLTFFEVITALAIVYFKEKKVDFAVLETGLGGRLDATNVVSPLVCAITPISYEHTQKLGNTLQKIATEKAGIIKAQSPIVVSAPQEEEARLVIRKKCKEASARLIEVNKGTRFKIRLLGKHQLINAAVAEAAIKALRKHGIKVSVDSIKKGLYNTLWPGRCEVAAKDPLIVLDGAQNKASAKALKEAIRSSFGYKKLILILGVSDDKDLNGICSELSDLADEIILTQADNPRATKPKVLAGYFRGRPAHITESVKEAKKTALRTAKKDDLILVTGSLFVVGEFKRC